jgi:soluble lytic murein transglycosylase
MSLGRSGKLPRRALGFFALSVLAVALGAAPRPGQASEAVYRDALRRLDAGDMAGANQLAATGHDPLLDKVVRWIEISRLHAPTSFAEIQTFIEKNPDWPRQAALRLRAEEQILLEAGPEGLLAWFAGNPPQSRDGKIRYGEALRIKGREAEGIGWIRRAWVEDNFSAPEEKVFLEKFHGLIPSADQVQRLDSLIWRQQFDQAKRQMNRVDEGHRWVADARMKLLADQGGFDAALRKVPASLENDPGLLYARIHWRRVKGHDADARALMLKVPANVPRPELWWRERESEIRQALTEGANSEAYRLARDHRQTQGTQLADAEFLAGWIALRLQHDPHVAFGHFENLYNSVRTPVSQARGAYWAGRAQEAEQKSTLARGWYEKAAQHPTTFYGQLAAAKLGRDAAKLPADPAPDKKTTDAFAKREVTRAVAKLAEIGAATHVDPFVLRLADLAHEPEEAALTAELARKVGRPDLGVTVARRVARQGITLVEAGYPLLSLKQSAAAEPALTYSVIRQESNFAAEAVSRAGARGLMQLMPATAKAIAAKLNLPFSEGKLVDPTYNVALGENYLMRIVGRFDGSYVLGLAAYNAGPARVHQWLQQIGDPRGHMDVIDWIERLPFAETRNYVERVLEGLQVYRLRLGSPLVSNAVAAVPPAASAWCLLACLKEPVMLPAQQADDTLEDTPGDGGSGDDPSGPQ